MNKEYTQGGVHISISNHAQRLLASKGKKPYYSISYYDEVFNDTRHHPCTLTNDELEGLRTLRARYGSDEYFNHLEEVFYDSNRIYDLTLGYAPIDFNLDTPYYMYEFGLHELVDGKLETTHMLLSLSDEEYIRLINLCIIDEHMNYNALKHADNDLYGKLEQQIDNGFIEEEEYAPTFKCHFPYLVTMDEVQADAEQIIKEHPYLRQ